MKCRLGCRNLIFAFVAAVLALTLCGCATSLVPMEEYSVVFDDVNGGRTRNCAREVQKYILFEKGTRVPITASAESAPNDGYEILIGDTGRPESLEAVKGFVTPMDYTIRTVGNKIVIAGGTPYATAAATEKFLEIVKEQGWDNLRKKGISYDWYFDTSWLSPLCQDASSFVPTWAPIYKVPEWMDDFYETVYALTQKDGRLTAFAHRGDFEYYPQSSLEGFLSSILAGADVVEVDFRLTKDNIPVLMHDEDLRINTNCASKMGKNGLPNSYLIGDWTYEQLRELNMVRQGGYNTTCKVPTCYEALLVAKQFGAQLAWDDKSDETIRPVFAATVGTTFEDMLPLILKTDSLEYFLYYYSYYHQMTDTEIWKGIEGTSEKFRAIFTFWEKCVKKALAENGAIPGVFGFWNDARYKSWKYDTHYESARYWDLWYEEGKTQIWTNSIVPCCRHIAATYGPDDYSDLMK